MSLTVIVVCCLVSLFVSYFIFSPFLVVERKGFGFDIRDNLSENAIKHSFVVALDSLDASLETGAITREEYDKQKELLLKDASRVILE